MRLGILGGTFDPVHYGHLLLAECCREQCRLDMVWFMPAAVPPHKQQQAVAPAEQRLEMLDLAIAGQAAFASNRYEVDRGGVNFTVDTLAHLKTEDPARELFFLMGADSLAEFPTWREPGRICQLAMLVVVYRAGQGTTDAGDEPDFTMLARLVPPDRIALFREHRVAMPRIDLSSSEMRRRVAAGQSIRYRTPRAVEKYIESHALYTGGDATAGRRA